MTAQYPYGKDFRRKLAEGTERDRKVPEILDGYRQWVSVEDYAVLRNGEGEFLPSLCCKLGNGKHARRKAAQYAPMIEAFDSQVFDAPIPGCRKEGVRACCAFLITLTYDHKLYTAPEAYRRCGEDINRFKAALRKVLGRFATRGPDGKLQPVPYVSMSVKEGTMSGYPAPHLIVITPGTVFPVFRQRNGKWRVQSYQLYRDIHEAWYLASGGSANCDVEAIVGNRVRGRGRERRSAISYALKYVVKSSDGSSSDNESQQLADLTHAMLKYTNQRDIIGRRFLAVLGLVDAEKDIDLMRMKNELKRLRKRVEYLEEVERVNGAAFGWLGSPQYAELRRSRRRMDELAQEIARIENPQEWFYVGTRRFRPDQKAQLQTWLDSFAAENERIRQQREHSRDYDDPRFIAEMMRESSF